MPRDTTRHILVEAAAVILAAAILAAASGLTAVQVIRAENSHRDHRTSTVEASLSDLAAKVDRIAEDAAFIRGQIGRAR